MNAPRGRGPLPVTVDTRGYSIAGKRYPRVTNIVGHLPKPQLISWAAKAVAEYAVAHRATWQQLPDADAVKLLKGSPWSQRDAAADRGTAIHKVIEAYLTGQPMPVCTEEELDVAIAAERFLLDCRPDIIGTEVTVYSPAMQYAGTCDLACSIGTAGWLIDWKTGKAAYPEYAVQLAAYALAERAILNGEDVEWGPMPAARLGVLHLQPTGYTLYEVTQPMDVLERVWHALIEVAAWCKTQDEALTVSSPILPLEVA